MVIRDLFFSESPSAASTTQPPRLASPVDRLIAAVFDFLIFSPIISLSISGLLREVKTYLLMDSQSPEAGVIWLIFLGTGFFLSALVPAIFLYHWGATPGQKFLHLRVVSWPDKNEPLGFGRCFLRSFLALVNLLFCGIPFLEIFTHPLRRAFHERATDTLVVTSLGRADRGPTRAEQNMVSAWIKMFFVMLFAGVVIFTAKSYLSAKHGLFARTAEAQGFFCADVSENAEEGESIATRMDRALALFLAGEVDEDCIGKESQRALWGKGEGDSEWAYLAAAFADQDSAENQDRYFKKVCELKNSSEVCNLAKYFAKDDKDRELKLEKPISVTARMILLGQELEQKDYPSALQNLKSLRSEEYLSSYLEKEFVRIVWNIDHNAIANRAPASEEQSEVMKEFKEKYGVE